MEQYFQKTSFDLKQMLYLLTILLFQEMLSQMSEKVLKEMSLELQISHYMFPQLLTPIEVQKNLLNVILIIVNVRL